MLFCTLFYTGEGSFELQTEADSNDDSRIYTRQNQYTCTQCEKRLSSKRALCYHMKIHRGEYKCTECGRCYGSKHHLAVHMRSHSGDKPFECTVCGKLFIQPCNLMRHSRIHSGEKPCHVLKKSFTGSGTLSSHVRVHEGKKRYKCSICY